MIESNVIKYVDIGDSIQMMNVYSKKSLKKFFKIFELLTSFKINNILFQFLLKIVFFLQIMDLSLINVSEDEVKNDTAIKIIRSLKKVLLITNNITTKKNYVIISSCSIFYCFLILVCFIYVVIVANREEDNKSHKIFPIKLLNILNISLLNYGLCQVICISLLTTKCDDNVHIYLKIKCYSDIKHFILLIITMGLLLFVVIYSFMLSIYYYEIGNLQNEISVIRINCVYELLENSFQTLFYILAYILKYYIDDEKKYYRYGCQLVICFCSFIIMNYAYQCVFFYEQSLNYLAFCGWGTTAWFTFSILMRNVFSINNSFIFFIVGILIIYMAIYSLEKRRIDYCLTEANIFEAKNIKQIETFTHYLLNICNDLSNSSKVLVTGIIKSFQEIIDSNIELSEKSSKFLENSLLQKKFGSNQEIFHVYNIIFLIYDYYYEKPDFKNNILFIMCFFLVNKLKNPSYAVYLCSKVKISGHKDMFLKYIVMEKLKRYQINKLIQNNKKESVKHLEIGSVILYNNYLDNFKIKIYDAACNQVDYFDVLKNNINSKNTTSNFLKIGNTIIKLRKDIIDLWDKIMKLNPFCEENERDYMLYVETIIQDNELAQKEDERFNQYRNARISEKNNLYYSMFNKDISCVLLIDGYVSMGKILYSSPNFGPLFNFFPKECINITINDLMPNNIANFHKELISYTLKYSNLTFVFNKWKKAILKGKNNSIYNINLFIKCIPSMSYGLIYMVLIEKLKENNFVFVLDENFKIMAMSDVMSLNTGNNFNINNSSLYNLNSNIIGYHIAIVLPEILSQIEYKDQKYLITKDNIDLKADLYPNTENVVNYDKKIEVILEKIRQSGKLIKEEKVLNNTNTLSQASNILLGKETSNINKKNVIKANSQEYTELLNDLNNIFKKNKFSIFYRLIASKFINDKFVYYRVYISNDLINGNNNQNFGSVIEETLISKTNLINNFNNNQALNPNKIKGIKIIQNDINNNENKPLLNEEKNEEEGEENNNNHDNKNENNNLKNNNNNDNNNNNNINNNLNIVQQEKLISPQNSINSKDNNTAIDSATFNRLKLKVINQSEPIFIAYMRLILLFYSLLSITFIVLDDNSSKDTIDELEQYLFENLFFNRSKVSATCIFNNVVYIKYAKFDRLNSSNCLNISCGLFYGDLLYECIPHLREFMDGILYYDIDYINILYQRKMSSLYGYKIGYAFTSSMDYTNFLNLFISNSLILYHHIDTVILNQETLYDATLDNIINQTYYYGLDKDLTGFDYEKKREKSDNKRFNKNYLFLIINCILFIVAFAILSLMIIKLNKIENYFLRKLIRFSNIKFDNYLKYLEELKKKLRNDTGEDDENNLADENKKNTDSDEDEKNDNKLNKKLTRGETEKKGGNVDHKKKKNRKKMANKLNKLQQQRNEKYDVMSKYFYTSNLLSACKFASILILYMLYYVIIVFLFIEKKKDFLDFDDTLNTLEGIYKTTSEIFIEIRKQELNYLNFTVLKEQAIQKLNATTDEDFTVEFNGENYTKNEINELNSLIYQTELGSLEVPTIGNLLLSLIKDVNIDESSSAKSQLKILYNGDSCTLLFSNNETLFNECINLWSSILLQGYEQGFLQLSVLLVTYKKEITAVNRGEKQLSDLNETRTNLIKFIDLFFQPGFLKTVELMMKIRKDKIKNVNRIFDVIMYIYIILACIFCIILFIFIYTVKKILCNFLNFIGILPLQYLSDDEDLFTDVLKLDKQIY